MSDNTQTVTDEEEDQQTKVSSKNYTQLLESLEIASSSSSDFSELETEFQNKMKPSNNDWWNTMKQSLAKDTEKQYLEPEKKKPSFRKTKKKTLSWAENKEAVLASVRDPRWSFDPQEPLPSNWWDSMKQSLEDSPRVSATPTVPTTPTPPATTSSSGSWWDQMKNELEDTPEKVPLQPSISVASQDDSGSWWDSMKDNLEKESTTSETASSVSSPGNSQGVTPSSSPNRVETLTRDTLLKARSRAGSIPVPYGFGEEGSVLKIFNGLYRGDTVQNSETNVTAHGNGIFTASSGEIYVGQWNNGKRHGKGLRTWQDGKEYIGHWDNNKRTGNGLMGWNNGEVYIGESQYGFQQGNGMMTYSNGDKYIGEWHVSEREGHGMMIYKNGDVYSGEWKHNKRDGYGVLRSADGKNSKEGLWKDNKFVGKEKSRFSFFS